MSLDKYEFFKQRYENVKPIRGRSVECRPIANRARDWEQIVKVEVDGQTAYGAHLYQTDCILAMPNGDLHVKSGGWATPTTAEFISRYLPHNMMCYKKYNKIWVEHKGQAYPIDTTAPTIFKFINHTDGYTIENPIQLTQKVVDRVKANEARKKLNAFRNYAKIMLKLGDGWLSNELVEQHCEANSNDYWGRRTYKVSDKLYTGYELQGQITSNTAETLYNAMCTDDETLFPKLLCVICASSQSEDSRVVKQEQVERTDYSGNKRMETVTTRESKYKYTTVDNRINHIIKQACDVYTTKEVPIGKIVTNVV